MKTKKIAEISITRLNERGNGEGFYKVQEGDSREAEVPFTCSGDVVLAELRAKKKGLRQASLREFIALSPERVSPRCKHFAMCGGCRLQHIPYEKQLVFKTDIVANLFAPIVETDKILPIIGAPSPWRYRNKMEFSFSQNKAKEKFLGLMMARGRVADLQECHLVNEWFTEALAVIRKWWGATSVQAYNPYRDTGALRTLTLREGLSSGDRFVMLTVSGNPDYALHQTDIEGFVDILKREIMPSISGAQLGISLRIHQAIQGRPTEFFDMHLFGPDFVREAIFVHSPLEFQVSPVAFFQPNPRQAEILFQKAIEMAGPLQDRVVYDLFCGTGTLGICIAGKAKQVMGIEIVPEAVYDARANAAANGLDNITFLEGDVHALLQEIVETGRFPLPDVIFVDPPRAGLGEKTIQTLLKIRPSTLVYISCNPKSQAEDVKALLKEYAVTLVQSVDQFPQTPHIENIVILRRV